jgi:hypothetical protein
MKPPPRLIDGGDVRARLLRSARADGPSGRSRQRATAAIALAAGALTTRSTAALAAATVARSALLKVLLGAGMVTLVTAGALDAPVTTAVPAERAVAIRPPPRAAPVAPSATARVAAMADPSPAPPVSVAVPSPPPAVKTSATPHATDTLSAEVALLGEAKRALGAGQTAAAFTAIATYDRRFPGGALAQEAAALRIEASARSGDHAMAASLFRSFEARYPASPLRDRLRALGAAQPD